MPGGGGDGDDEAGALGSHDREHGAGDVDRAEQGGLDLGPEVVGGDLLEEPGVEAAGVVDQHVDASEPLDRGGDRGVGVRGVGDVELHRRAGSSWSPRAAVTASGLRAVATTAWPAARAALAMSTPMPRAGAGDDPDLVVHVLGPFSSLRARCPVACTTRGPRPARSRECRAMGELPDPPWAHGTRVPWRHGPRSRAERVPHLEAAAHHPRAGRAARLRRPGAGSPGCAARRSRMLAGVSRRVLHPRRARERPRRVRERARRDRPSPAAR